jgi:hypothetical protein
MAVRGMNPDSQAVSKTCGGKKFLKACLETAWDWSCYPKLSHSIPRRINLLLVGIAFVVAARAATIPTQFRVLEDDDAIGVVRQVSSIAGPVANRQRQKHLTVRVSKSETSVAEPSKRHGQPSEEKLAKAREGKLSTKQSSTARNGVSHDKIQPINQGSLNRDR